MPPTDSNNDKPSILKTTREAKGLTLEIVHEATKIPMDALRAIEEGYKVRILSPFYYKGFIKIYSEFLGLDVGEMYKQYGLHQPPPLKSSISPSLKPNRPEVLPNAFLEAVQEWLAFVLKPKTLKLIFKIAGSLLLFLLFFKMVGCIGSHIHKKVEKKVKIYSDVEQVKSTPFVQQTKNESVRAQSDDNKVEVAVRASQDTWLRVKADERTVFETTLKKGSVESWSANNRIELSGRDLEQLDMEVNNKQIGYLGGGDRRVRKVLITHEGLTVKK